MTATATTSASVLKTRFEKGRLPKAQYEEFPFVALLTKNEDFTGNNKVVALQTENPQGVSTDFATALGSLSPGTYNAFTITRIRTFGIARVTGEALKATKDDMGAFVDLWKNETDGVSQTQLKSLEWHCTRDGSGRIGTITVSGSTNTMQTTEDIAGIDMGMRIETGDFSTPLTPTMRTGNAWVVQVDRKAGSFQVSSTQGGAAVAIGTLITNAQTGDGVCRAGESASAGTPRVVTGTEQWFVGGTTPGTLFGLNRNPDPVRRAGQVEDESGKAMEDAIIDLESLITFQGKPTGKTCFVNSRDVRKWKKSLGGKFTYPRGKADSKLGVSFSTIEFDGENGPIRIVSSPFHPVARPQLLDLDYISLDSMGPCPQMLDWDGNNFLRVASDDAYEVRFGLYGQLNGAKAPSRHARGTGWGT